MAHPVVAGKVEGIANFMDGNVDGSFRIRTSLSFIHAALNSGMSRHCSCSNFFQ